MPYSFVTDIRAVGDSLKVSINNPVGGNEIVEIASDLRVADVSFSDGYWHAHEELEATGSLHHGIDECPELAERRIRIWKPLTGWVEQRVVPTFRSSGH